MTGYNLHMKKADDKITDIRIEEVEYEYASLRDAAQAFLTIVEDHPETPVTEDALRTARIHASGRW